MRFREIRIDDEQLAVVSKEIREGNLTSGDWVSVVESMMRQITGARHVVAVSSGTMALEVSVNALASLYVTTDMRRVAVPNFGFASCVNVVMNSGIDIVFCDVDGNGMLDVEKLAPSMRECDVDAIMPIRMCGEEVGEGVFGLGKPVIVDSAHSMDRHDPRAFATCYSFHPSKIVSGIEGGAIATNDDATAMLMRELRSFGFGDGTRVQRRLGYKGNMTNVSAALIAGNLNRIGWIRSERERVRGEYNARLGMSRRGIGMYMVNVDDPDEVCAKIPAIRHYPRPLSSVLSPIGDFPRTKFLCDHAVSLPFHEWLSTEDVDEVCAIVKERIMR